MMDWKNLSGADLVAIVGLIAGFGYAEAQIVQHNQEIAELKAKQATIWNTRENDRSAIDSRLERIESKVDTVIGELNARRQR